ncbi:phosphatase PAP2 family protein [Jeotgalicoccus coquinae]|uniref:Phosphatidylglycerophosphatase B n=1 Tax=Jeotgalicoccus coquinae TaxID=709509 RepID=A0A6V7R8D2_9STAP|nr:phosphatase PAP2 family protein [Jeotgalicoccus coquinae]MBB6422987.1 undecaprenyl-diphosphatase [Jeotgalicoccus coquinae]GGE11595.1 phosphatase PAP2 family protein [Jeotgalicoccus coquinae]CAD2073546.1 phosphatidylglycerophosphatase B [Jeotgalicoccus coquinae]
MSRSKKMSLFLVFTLIFGVIAIFHESRLGRWIDREVYEFIYASESFITTALMLGFTQLGEVLSMIIMSLILISILMLYKLKIHTLFILISMIASSILIPVLKNSFDRERPSMLRLIEISGFSFPSGHAMGSTIFFGSLGTIIKHTDLNNKALLMTVCATFILMISSSRVYLGVHYPTDVLAGVVIGLAVVVGTSALLHKKFRKPGII